MASSIGRQVERPQTSAPNVQMSTSKRLFASQYPLLQRFLDEPRKSPNHHQTGSLTLFCEDERYKLCLNDRPNQRSTFVSGGTLGEAFRIADNGLRSDTLRWRSRGWADPSQKKLFADPS